MSKPPTRWLRAWVFPDVAARFAEGDDDPGRRGSLVHPGVSFLASIRVHLVYTIVAVATLAMAWVLSAAGVAMPEQPAAIGWTLLTIAATVYAADAVLTVLASSPLDAAVDTVLRPIRAERREQLVGQPRPGRTMLLDHAIDGLLGLFRSRPDSPRESVAEREAPRMTLADPAAALDPGDVVGGRYELRETIGSGAVSTVWLATDRDDQQLAAVSVYDPSANVDSRALRADFTRGAEALERLSGHPNVVELYGRGDHPVPWMATEYVAGGSLDEHLPLPLPDAASVLDQVAEAIAFGHERGVVHGDIKPSNVLVEFGPDGPVPKVTDWAKRPEAGDAEAGMLTPAYAAPEQFDGPSAGQREATDVYQLGVLGYELLTGRRPFGGRDDEIEQRIRQTEPAPPSSADDGLPEAVDEVLGRALAKNPGDRYPTVASLRAALPDSEALPDRLPASAATGQEDAAAGTGRTATSRDSATTVVGPSDSDDETTLLLG